MSASSAGVSRRYQRSVPSAIARTADRSSPDSTSASAASAERPPATTASTTRAAPARAAAPGAHRVLAKAPSHDLEVVGEFGHRQHPAAGLLHLPDTQQTALSALNQHDAVTQGDDRPRS